MYSSELEIQLPAKKTIVKSKTQPISIPIKTSHNYCSGYAPSSISTTPPSDFIEHLKKRVDQFATSPIFVYNKRN